MAVDTNIKVAGVPQQWLQADLNEAAPVTDPGLVAWSKPDPAKEEYWYDASKWRFPSQTSLALVLYDVQWAAAIPGNAEIQSIEFLFTRFLRGQLGQLNDVEDHGIVPTMPSGAGGNTPKPDDQDYSTGQRWPSGQLSPGSAFLLSQSALTGVAVSATELLQNGFGVMYSLKTNTGRIDGGGSNGQGMGILDPSFIVTYNVEVP